MWSLNSMYPTVVFGIFCTFCTGVLVTLAELSVTSWGVVAPTSRIEKVWFSPTVAGERPALSEAAGPLVTSTPSTLSTLAPRAMGALEPGGFGSTYATRTARGAGGAVAAHRTPYP